MENPFNNILFRHRENIKIIIKIEAIKMFPFLLKIETVFIHLPFHYMFVVSIFTISEIKFKYVSQTDGNVQRYRLRWQGELCRSVGRHCSGSSGRRRELHSDRDLIFPIATPT